MAIDTSADDARVRLGNRVPSRRDKSRIADSRSSLAFAAIVASFSTHGCARESSADPIAQFSERLGVSFVRRIAEERGRFVTSKAEDYRRRARACLLMAGTIADDETRAALVEMAQVWTRLADEDAATAPPGTVAESPPVMQQQQQIQSKKKEK